MILEWYSNIVSLEEAPEGSLDCTNVDDAEQKVRDMGNIAIAYLYGKGGILVARYKRIGGWEYVPAIRKPFPLAELLAVTGWTAALIMALKPLWD